LAAEPLLTVTAWLGIALCNEFFLVTERAFAGDHFKVLVKTGKVVEPAFVAKLFDAQVVFDEQLTGLAYAYFYKELRIGFACPGFEITAEGVGADIGHGSNLFQLDLAFIVLE
jgi:hypothetical protein